MFLLLVLASAVTVAAQTAPAQAPETADQLKLRLEQMQRRLQDWPLLSRYRDANAKLLLVFDEQHEGQSVDDGLQKIDGHFVPGVRIASVGGALVRRVVSHHFFRRQERSAWC